MNLRKLIIRFFALDYISIVGGTLLSWPRAANIIFPIFCIDGIAVIAGEHYIADYLFTFVLMPITFLVIFLGFWYFKVFKPVKFGELGMSQKWQLGKLISQGHVDETLSVTELIEWNILDANITREYTTNKLYNIIPFIVNPIILITTIIITLYL